MGEGVLEGLGISVGELALDGCADRLRLLASSNVSAAAAFGLGSGGSRFGLTRMQGRPASEYGKISI